MAEEDGWVFNYFNYFTEVEEHFRKARGTGLFLLSPLDWALIESWKGAGVPLEAVLRGIDAAFEKWRGRKTKTRLINSLAYCAQAVMEEAAAMAGMTAATPAREAAPPFTLEELREYLSSNLARLRGSGDSRFETIAAVLDGILEEVATHYQDLEQLEQRLTAIEDKMLSIARAHQSEEDLFQARRGFEEELRPYRGKMTAEQLAMLERRYLDRRLFEKAGLPRLSLFYLA